MMRLKEVVLFFAAILFSLSSVAKDSTQYDKRGLLSGGGPSSVDVNNYKTLFSNIRGKQSALAYGRTGGAYGYVRVADDGSFVRIYDTSNNLLRTLACFANCSMTKNSQVVVYKNPGFIGDSEWMRLPTENIDFVVITNQYVKIGYHDGLYYGYWED